MESALRDRDKAKELFEELFVAPMTKRCVSIFVSIRKARSEIEESRRPRPFKRIALRSMEKRFENALRVRHALKNVCAGFQSFDFNNLLELTRDHAAKSEPGSERKEKLQKLEAILNNLS